MSTELTNLLDAIVNANNVPDQLGLVNAQIAELQKLQKELKAWVVTHGEPISGDFYNATPVFQDRDVTDWKAVAAKLQPSRQLIAAHTKHTATVSVRVTGRKQAAA